MIFHNQSVIFNYFSIMHVQNGKNISWLFIQWNALLQQHFMCNFLPALHCPLLGSLLFTGAFIINLS